MLLLKFLLLAVARASCDDEAAGDGSVGEGAAADSGQCAWPSEAQQAPAILALSGSLRRASANSGLLRAAMAGSSSVAAAPVLLSELPFFDADVEAAPEGLPPAVAALRAAAFAARGFLFATPEYNGLTSAVLKNALDWLSRRGPEGRSPLSGKPFAVVSAGGSFGGARAQRSVEAIAGDVGMKKVDGRPQIAVKLFDGVRRFDEATGDLLDGAVRAELDALVAALEAQAREN
jgi:chromate reductase